MKRLLEALGLAALILAAIAWADIITARRRAHENR